MLCEYKKINRFNHFVILILVVLTISSCFCVPTYACEGYDEGEKPASNCTVVKHWDSYAKETLDNHWKYFAYSMVKGKYTSVANMLEIVEHIFDWDLPDTVNTLINKAIAATTTIGKTLCFLYFLLELLDKATRDNFTVEGFVKSFAKLMILFVIFQPANLTQLSGFGETLNDYLMTRINDTIHGTTMAELSSFIDELKSVNWIKAIGIALTFENTLPSITWLLTSVVAFMMAFGRIIEVSIYKGMLPLGLSSIYGGGLHSPGFRYIKKFIALELQGVIMYFVLVAGVYLSRAAMENIVALGVIADLIYAVGTIAILVKSKSIANDIVGV